MLAKNIFIKETRDTVIFSATILPAWQHGLGKIVIILNYSAKEISIKLTGYQKPTRSIKDNSTSCVVKYTHSKRYCHVWTGWGVCIYLEMIDCRDVLYLNGMEFGALSVGIFSLLVRNCTIYPLIWWNERHLWIELFHY